MALDVYFRDELERDLISDVTMFMVGQLTAENIDMAACGIILAFAVAHGVKYKIEPEHMIDCIRAAIMSASQRQDVDQMSLDRLVLTLSCQKPRTFS